MFSQAILTLPMALVLVTAACSGSEPQESARANETATRSVSENDVTEVAEAPATPAAPAETVPPSTLRPAEPIREPSQARIKAEYSAALETCLNSGDAANGVSVAMGACVNNELTKQDQRLNRAYQAALATRDAAGKTRLRNEERAWIKERDDSCEEVRSGGTIDMVEVPFCRLDATISRRMVLEQMAG